MPDWLLAFIPGRPNGRRCAIMLPTEGQRWQVGGASNCRRLTPAAALFEVIVELLSELCTSKCTFKGTQQAP